MNRVKYLLSMVTEKENDYIMKKAASLSLSPSEYLRILISTRILMSEEKRTELVAELKENAEKLNYQDSPRTSKLKTTVTEEEFEIVKAFAKEQNTNVSSLLRYMATQ